MDFSHIFSPFLVKKSNQSTGKFESISHHFLANSIELVRTRFRYCDHTGKAPPRGPLPSLWRLRIAIFKILLFITCLEWLSKIIIYKNKKAELPWIHPSAAQPSFSKRPAAFRPHLTEGLALSGESYQSIKNTAY
jgi:hypothetical protein